MKAFIEAMVRDNSMEIQIRISKQRIVNSRRKVHIIVGIEIHENHLCTFSLIGGAKSENLTPNGKYSPKKIMPSFTFDNNYVDYWVYPLGTNLFEHIVVSEFPLQQLCSS